MDPRARYPPDIGNGRGGNPYYYGRGPPPHQQQPPPHVQAHHQQYVQRQQQPSQHQQWLRRNQIAGEGAGAAGASDHKAPPAADGIDSRVTASELLKPAAGTTDGPGAFDFKQGDVKGNPFWKLVRNLLKPPGKEQVECQAPKPILLDTGEMKEPYDWAPAILPIQMIRIGQLVILCVPGEFTTMAGRRLRDAVKNVLTSGSNGEFNNNIHVVLAGMTNTY